MSTPLYDALTAYQQKKRSRFHMPGHKGVGIPLFSSVLPFDVTEVEGTDSLYCAEQAIAETEARYSELYGTARTLLSAGGSTLCIQTMLSLAVPPGSTIVSGRNIHVSALNTFALLDLRPVWVYPEKPDDDNLYPFIGRISPADVSRALSEHPSAAAVYITSPDYYGVISDIAEISRICHARNIPLLVDNAHGAHLKFLPTGSQHPIDQGADLCCDSLHKTLPVLTGGALLHIKNPRFAERAKCTMSLYGSTSPNYLIMLSIDLALEYIQTQLRDDLQKTAKQVERLQKLAAKAGFTLPDGPHDTQRLSLGFLNLGITGEEIATRLRQSDIEPEYAGNTALVLLVSAFLSSQDYKNVEDFLAKMAQIAKNPQKLHKMLENRPLPRPVQKMSLRDALFSTAFSTDVENSIGKTAAGMVCPCPPGIPLLMYGEQIDEVLAKVLKNYGVNTVYVVK